MKKVHDIIIGVKSNGGRPIAISFIQHGNKADGFVYENICPFCAASLEKVTANPDAEMTRVYARLQKGMAEHIDLCPRRGANRFEVEKTRSPLKTDKLIREI